MLSPASTSGRLLSQGPHTPATSTAVFNKAATDVARQDWDTLFRAVISRLLETAAELPTAIHEPGQDLTEIPIGSLAATRIRECVQSLEQLRRTAGHTHLLGADPQD